MNNLVVVTSKRIGQEELRSFVEAWGGYWNDEPTLNQGVIERRRAVVYVSLCWEIEREYEADEIVDLKTRLGATPRAYIDVHIGHQRGSQELAHEFAKSAIAEWQGCLDDALETRSLTSS